MLDWDHWDHWLQLWANKVLVLNPPRETEGPLVISRSSFARLEQGRRFFFLQSILVRGTLPTKTGGEGVLLGDLVGVLLMGWLGPKK